MDHVSSYGFGLSGKPAFREKFLFSAGQQPLGNDYKVHFFGNFQNVLRPLQVF